MVETVFIFDRTTVNAVCSPCVQKKSEIINCLVKYEAGFFSFFREEKMGKCLMVLINICGESFSVY